MRRSSMTTLVCCGTLATALVAAPAHARPGSEPETVAEGLIGPLTLAVHDNSPRVYVTQSFAGLLTQIDRKGQTHLVADDNPENGEIVGVSLRGSEVYYIDTDYAAGTSHVMSVDKRGMTRQVSDDLFAYEAANNPDGGMTYGFTGLDDSCAAELAAFEESYEDLPPLSEYTGIIESHGYQTSVQGRDVYVADAAANAVLRVDGRTGAISTVAVLPAPAPVTITPEILGAMLPPDAPSCLAGASFVSEPVPTDVEVGDDGMLYVSTLGGGLGEAMPLSSVYRVDPSSGATTWVAGGMQGATGLDLRGQDIVVAEMFGGEVSMIRAGSTTAETLFAAHSPADVEVHGSMLYATTGTFAESGSVVRLHLR